MSRAAWVLRLWLVVGVCLAAGQVMAQPKKPAAHAAPAADDDGSEEPSPPPAQTVRTSSRPAMGLPGAQRIIRVSRPAQVTTEIEIFPDARKVHMHVYGVDPSPIEAARRDAPGSWGCRPASGESPCQAELPEPDNKGIGDSMLLSIGLSSPTSPLPIPIWTRGEGGDGVLLYNPILIGRSTPKVTVFGPVTSSPAPTRAAPAPSASAPIGSSAPAPAIVPRPAPPGAVAATPASKPATAQGSAASSRTPAPMAEPTDQGSLTLAMRWPREAEASDFRYLAIVDSCGTARVQPFQRTFSVPVAENFEDSCPQVPDGRVLRVFPRGGYLRVTAFNLTPDRSGMIAVTYRVSVPALDGGSDATSPRLLFPDLGRDDLRVECGVSDDRGKRKEAAKEPKSGATPPKRVDHRPGQPLADQTFVIAPGPLQMGTCRIRFLPPSKGRLQAPLALHVQLERVDKPSAATIDYDWVVTYRSTEFVIPPLRQDFEPESRWRLRVSSDPLSALGRVVLLADAARVWPVLRDRQGEAKDYRREIAAATIISAPLCGGWQLETTEQVGNCLRAYVTLPLMIASFQVTRSPWKETTIAEPRVPAGIGLALAIDSYNPVRQQPFPLAVHLGALYQNLTDSKTGIMTYVGLAPQMPVLGKGGTTTSIGLVLGGGVTYVMDKHGPNEGFKPAAFIALMFGAGAVVLNGSSAAVDYQASGAAGMQPM